MGTNIFEYLSYREYLKHRLESQGAKSGLKRRAAEALKVHTTFISQVVLGRADLSLDQAERMNSFLNHVDDESEFFLDLVIYERAAEEKLKKRIHDRIRKKHVERSQIKGRLADTSEISANDQERFYSSHIYGLMHVLASIPSLQARASLIGALGLPPEIANDAIDFLLRIKVLKAAGGRLLPTEQHIHLGKSSREIWRHHANWRLATLQHFPFGRASDLHYSLTFSCSEQDAHKIRESLLEHLRDLTAKISGSKEEKAFVYCFDFFQW